MAILIEARTPISTKLLQPGQARLCSRRNSNGNANKLAAEDAPAHDWYRFILSYPPHLVRRYVDHFSLTARHIVLDPFCGTGTTLVECKKLGIPSVGIEATPMAHFASKVKTDWTPDPDDLLSHAERIADLTDHSLRAQGIIDHPGQSDPKWYLGRKSSLRSIPPQAYDLLLTDSISPLPLHKALVLLDQINTHQDERYIHHERLALAKALVRSISNLHFGPEVGIGPAKNDTPVIKPWLTAVRGISDDLRLLRPLHQTSTAVHQSDARQILHTIQPGSVDAIITSPPYPNEKDYTRTTRLESVILGFIRSKADLQMLKRTLIRSNTRTVYKGDEDHLWVRDNDRVQEIARAIERRRVDLGKTSGFERMYHKVTTLYFGGMARHLADLRSVLRPGAQLAYVVGDQASYLRVMIRTGQLLAEIAQSLGYEVTSIDLFRTRLATATKEQLREEVLLLRWPGVKSSTTRKLKRANV